ncbi:MAG: hypothetical protein E7287_06640 [Lachnospiraceae bacterium]|nr:hypothetical protein [Lachnospiraceae bacterium]
MIAIQITGTKNFMNQLLAGDTFDIFLLEEAVISTANTYTIDGHINKDFYPSEEQTAENIPYDFQPWSEIKGMCFDLIKGKHTPLYFKFVFHLKPEHCNALLSKEGSSFDITQLKALVLTVKYDGNKAVLTTGSAYHSFIMSKEPENIWDKAFSRYLSTKEITFEHL